jgi:hypothetical protein
LDLPFAGHPLHTRALTLLVSELGGGRVRALGNVIDLRKSGFASMFGDVQPAGVIHDMEIDARVELASGTLEQLAVTQRRVAVEPAPITRGESCRDPAPRLQTLVGRKIDAAFTRELGAVQGGPRDCSHLLILFQMIADALPRALERERGMRRQGMLRRERESVFRRSLLFDGALARPRALHLAVQLSDWHNAPDDGERSPAERLVHVHEVRVLAELDLSTGCLVRAQAAERERRETRASAAWVDRSVSASAIVGQPILPGLGSFVLQRLGKEPSDAMLAHALLHLAPGFVQCTALFAEHAPRDAADGAPPVPTGGYADSCYMWRNDGPLIQLRSDRARPA